MVVFMGKTETIKLRDGRNIGIHQVGNGDGFPVFHFHGLTSSRLEVELMASAAAEAGIRLIGLERPGVGLSGMKKGYRILDWPDDVLEVADSLGIAAFAVEGASAGGAYALACAYRIPERVSSCGLISTASPPDMVMRSGPREIRYGYWVANHLPLLFRLMLRATIHDADSTISYVRKQFGLQELSGRFADSIRESFRNGPDGDRADAFRVVRPWGFGPGDIAHERVFLWHGGSDTVMSAGSARLLARALPHCTAEFYPGEGHISVMVNHAKEILGSLKR